MIKIGLNVLAWLLAAAVVLLAAFSGDGARDGAKLTHIGNETNHAVVDSDARIITPDGDENGAALTDLAIEHSDSEDESEVLEAVACNDSGAVLIEGSHLPEAIALLKKAIEFDSTYARAHYNLGFAYHRSGKINDAIREYTTSWELRPHYYPPVYNLGVMYLSMGEWKLAREWLTRATDIKSSSDVASAYYNLGLVCSRLGDDQDARHNYREALRLRPAYVEARYNLALLLMGDGKYEQAAGEFEKTASLGLSKSKLFNNLGVCYSNLDKYEEAVASYRKAVNVDSANAPAWFNLGIGLNKLNLKEEAIDAYETALHYDSTSSETHYNLALLFGDLNMNDSALQHYREAVKIDTHYSRALYNMAHIFSDIGRDDSAAAYYRKVVDLDPSNTRAWFNLGLTYSDIDDYEKAAWAYRELLDRDPVNDRAVNNLGSAFLKLGAYDSAYFYYNRLVRLTELPQAYYNRAKACQRLEKIEQARADYQKAIELKPDYAGAYHNLALVEERDGNVDEAIRLLNKGIATGDAGWKSHWKLGQLYAATGRLQEAVKEYEMAKGFDPKSDNFWQEYKEIYAKNNALSKGH